jgi:DNA-directed RNA polymerase subunit RPC12/RpoP
MTEPEPTPRCPFCGSKKTYAEGHRNYFCMSCKRGFDDDPDEGGDYSTDPTRRMEQLERRRARR